MHFRRVGTLVIALVIATFAVPAAPAAAQPAIALSCLGTQRSYDTGNGFRWPETTYAVTTSNCNDINVKPTNFGMNVRACLRSSSTGIYNCNAWRGIPENTWGLAATDVLDGTRFYVEFDYGSYGQIAF